MADTTDRLSMNDQDSSYKKSPDYSEDDEQYVPQSMDEENVPAGHSLALRRLETANSMMSRHSQDVMSRVLSEGMSNRRVSTTMTEKPHLGGGRPYPPDLPDRDAWRVDFDGPDDPTFPQNWSMRRKLLVSAVLAFVALTGSWGSSIYAPGTPMLMAKFHMDEAVVSLGLAVYVFGFASGPIIWAPYSELRGRKEPLIVSSIVFTCFTFAVATAKDFQTLIICRFFAGFCGASPLTIVAAAFADMFNNEHRGIAMVIFAVMVFCGPMLSPVVGGFIAESYLGWRWLHYLTGIMGGAGIALLVFFFEETYAPLILCKKAANLRRQSGNWGIYAPFEAIELEIGELVTKNLARPLKLLFIEPIILLVTIYTSFVYGILYLCLDALPAVFGPGGYDFKGGVVYLPYIGLIIGCVIAAVFIIFLFEPMYVRAMKQNNFKPVPEMRLPPMMVGAVAFPIGIFWLCWTGNYHESVHWAVPAVSTLFIGFGLLLLFLPALNYIIDSYLMFAASAIAANTILRSAFGGAFPLFGAQMFRNLGTNWAGTLVGCLAVALAPVPVIFWIYGKRIRTMSKFAQVLN